MGLGPLVEKNLDFGFEDGARDSEGGGEDGLVRRTHMGRAVQVQNGLAIILNPAVEGESALLAFHAHFLYHYLGLVQFELDFHRIEIQFGQRQVRNVEIVQTSGGNCYGPLAAGGYYFTQTQDFDRTGQVSVYAALACGFVQIEIGQVDFLDQDMYPRFCRSDDRTPGRIYVPGR